MDIKNLQDLSKIADLCRKKGIETIKITADSVEFKLKESVIKTRSRRKNRETQPDFVPVDNQPTEEELLYWSSAGVSDAQEGVN